MQNPEQTFYAVVAVGEAAEWIQRDRIPAVAAAYAAGDDLDALLPEKVEGELAVFQFSSEVSLREYLGPLNFIADRVTSAVEALACTAEVRAAFAAQTAEA